MIRHDWRKMPLEIPDSFVRRFGEWCAEHGVKGKYSIVPYPACVGWLDRFLPGWSVGELRDSLQLVRDEGCKSGLVFNPATPLSQSVQNGTVSLRVRSFCIALRLMRGKNVGRILLFASMAGKEGKYVTTRQLRDRLAPPE